MNCHTIYHKTCHAIYHETCHTIYHETSHTIYHETCHIHYYDGIRHSMSAEADGIPTAADVIAHLNQRFDARGLAVRVTGIAVLPYVNPMWMSNWEAPELAGLEDDEIIAEELREARWQFPQILD